MKQRALITFLLALCLMLCACAQRETPPATNSTPSGNQEQQPPSTPDDSPAAPDGKDDGAQPLSLDSLTVELVVEWEKTDALLSELDGLANNLQTALDEAGCAVERVVLTINTAGGFTAQALAQGGIDAAILPAVDFISCEANATAVALSGEELCETAIAVTGSNQELNEDFRSAFLKALTETATGQDFLAVCRPGAVFTPVTEEALQVLRDYLAAQEDEDNGGHP